MIHPSLFSSLNQEAATPPKLFQVLHAEFLFTVDAFASQSNTKLPRYWSLKTDGLEQSWRNERPFANPPYGQPENPCSPACTKNKCAKRGFHLTHYKPGIGDYIGKAVKEVHELKRCPLAVYLVHARTDTKWWHKYVEPWADEIRHVEGRVTFVDAGDANAPFPSVVVIYRRGSRQHRWGLPVRWRYVRRDQQKENAAQFTRTTGVCNQAHRPHPTRSGLP